jgi:hypothetical protein
MTIDVERKKFTPTLQKHTKLCPNPDCSADYEFTILQ